MPDPEYLYSVKPLHGVEKAAKIGGAAAAGIWRILHQSLTMGSSMATAEFPDANSIAGLNFL